MKGKKRIAVGIIFVLTVGILVLVAAIPALNHRYQSAQCGNQMASVGCGARIWAGGIGNYPTDFLSLSNEITNPLFLHCPADTARPILRSWAEVTPENISYEIVAPGIAAINIETVFFRCKVHGHLGYGDGTVFDGKQRRTKTLF